jgi:hypothetical protein
MPGLATVAQPQIHAAHARQQGQAGRFAGWTAKDHPTPSPARYTGRIEDAGDHAPRNQTRHKPRQSRILARRCAFRLVSQWETDHDLPTQSDTETGQIPRRHNDDTGKPGRHTATRIFLPIVATRCKIVLAIRGKHLYRLV